MKKESKGAAMSKLGVIEDTLFVPMLGRLYASEHCPQILYDQKALELKEKLPPGLRKPDHQSQYTLLASAARSANMDRFIRTFLERRPDGAIVRSVGDVEAGGALTLRVTDGEIDCLVGRTGKRKDA